MGSEELDKKKHKKKKDTKDTQIKEGKKDKDLKRKARDEKPDKSEEKDKKKKKEEKQKRESKQDQACVGSRYIPVSTTLNGAEEEFLQKHSIRVEKPDEINGSIYMEFDSVPVDNGLLEFLKRYPRPTPIQAVAWSYLLQDQDLIGVAETGSGKTMGFAVPAIQKIMDGQVQKALIISPTRELALQIHENIEELTSNLQVKTVCVYGGVPKDEQRKSAKKARIIIATPGRLKDLIEEGSVDLSQVQYLVLDEADRMLEKGFENEIRMIISNTGTCETRQTLMFTATWPPSVRDLAKTYMKPAVVKVTIGDHDELAANKAIEQIVEVIDPRRKESRLLELLQENQSGTHKDDKVLIFALYKKEATRVERFLQSRSYRVSAVHGDLTQAQRTQALSDFKKGTSKILLATDVAARGLDIPAVKCVINLTFPLTVEDYVHRIGRTGRAGSSGRAITLFTEHEKHLSGALINVLKGAGQPVPDDLLKFGSHTKKKEHSVYGAFFKDVDPTQKATKIKFDS